MESPDSVPADLEQAAQTAYLTYLESAVKLREWRFAGEELLPDRPTPRTECPGFERLAAIMDQGDVIPERDLIHYINSREW